MYGIDTPLKWGANSVTNGVIRVMVTNVAAMARSIVEDYAFLSPESELASWDDWCIEVGLRDCNNTNKHKNENWKTYFMEVQWMQHGCKVQRMRLEDLDFDYEIDIEFDIFHIRLPIYVTSYKMDMRLRLTYFRGYCNVWGDVQTIEIPSILVDDINCNEIGDKIKVTDILPDIHHEGLSAAVHKATIIGKVIILGNGEIKTITEKDTLPVGKTKDDNKGLQDEKEKEKESGKKEMNEKNIESEGSEGSVKQYIVELEKGYENIDYSDSKNYTFKVFASQIRSLNNIYFRNCVDTCNSGDYRDSMECDLILATSDNNIREFYLNLKNTISEIYKQADFLSLDESNYAPMYKYNFDYIGGYLSNNICTYLYDFSGGNNINGNVNHDKYQILPRCFHNCSLDSKHGSLYFVQHWTHQIEVGFKAKRLEKENNCKMSSQNFRHPFGNYCQLCHIFMHCNDWMAVCHDDVAHDYCFPCTYAITKETIQYQTYLKDIIHQYVDKNFTFDCIQILVSFIIGHVTKITYNH